MTLRGFSCCPLPPLICLYMHRSDNKLHRDDCASNLGPSMIIIVQILCRRHVCVLLLLLLLLIIQIIVVHEALNNCVLPCVIQSKVELFCIASLRFVTDVNECDGANSCDSNADCTNTQGSYSCMCRTGYQGNGMSCGGKNI